MIGQTLGHYKILDKLGAGGMGEVYRAEDTTLKRQIALKVLPRDLAASQERLERFQREAESLAALSHPNIVHVYSVEEDEGTHFITMELVEGRPLSQLIPKGGMLLERIFEIAIPLADALATAHEKGVIHRDLKPANIMVTDDGRLKVLDFGLAKLRPEAEVPFSTEMPTEPLTQEGLILGTMPYMSPEQLEGREIDHRSDIFSLGVVLYELATGERPFKGDTSVSLISSIVKDEPRPVDEVNEDLPHHLARVIRHCLEKGPARRYQSALDVRNELQDLRQEETSQSVTVTAPVPEPSASKGYRWWPVAAALLLLLVGTTAWLLLRREPGDEAVIVAEPQPPMIVVLPFENLGSPEDEYFADGMTEEITSRLAVVSGLRVISRTSAMQYKTARPPMKQIGEELGVNYVLEGTVRWARTAEGRGRVRITPQLIQVADDTHLWADAYDRVIDDIFEVQSDIAGKVIRALDVTLQGDEQTELDERPTDSIEAYQAYLRGIDLFERQLVDDSARMLRKAVELDPSFAQAWARLCRVLLFMYFKGTAGSESLDEARQALEQAQTHAPAALQVRLAEGYYLYHGLQDWDRALQGFKAIYQEFPNDPEILEGMAYIQRRQGRWQESTATLLSSLDLDPRNAWLLSEVAASYFSDRQFDAALTYVDQAIALRPDDANLYRMKLEILLRQGSIDAARATFAGASVTEPMSPFWLDFYYYDRRWAECLECARRSPRGEFLSRVWSDLFQGLALLQLDRHEEAREILQSAADLYAGNLTRQSRENAVGVSAVGLIYALLGRHNDAIAQLERASNLSHDPLVVEIIDEQLAWVYAQAGEIEAAIELWDRLLATAYYPPLTVDILRLDAFLDPIRDDPRFQALLEKYGQEGV